MSKTATKTWKCRCGAESPYTSLICQLCGFNPRKAA